ncbi:MAG TPA: flagellar protein FlaG [Bacillota bacterium]|nr:flagellar protein FlaG [Bacillota bacterium]
MRIEGAEIQTTVHHKHESHTNHSFKKHNTESFIENRSTDKKEVEEVVEALNQFTDPMRTSLQFKLHEDLNEYYVTVVDPLTQEVIKEIPQKKMLDMYAAMATYMGILIDEKI